MKRFAVVLAFLCLAGVTLGADQQSGTVSNFNQTAAGRNQTGQSTPICVTDGGALCSHSVSGTLISTGPDGGAVVMKPGYVITPASVQCMTCPVAGSNSYKVTQDCAEFSVQSETVFECGALTCVNDGGTVGVPYLVGSRGPRCWNQSTTGGADGGASGDKSCWSASGTGRICWVPIANP